MAAHAKTSLLNGHQVAAVVVPRLDHHTKCSCAQEAAAACSTCGNRRKVGDNPRVLHALLVISGVKEAHRTLTTNMTLPNAFLLAEIAHAARMLKRAGYEV